MGQLVRAVAASRRSTELFKTLERVKVVFNPYDHRSTTAREFLRRIRAPPVKKANPKLGIEVALCEDYGTAVIDLKYTDGFEQQIQPSGMKITDIIDQVERVARWRGDSQNPFAAIRAARAKQLGLSK